MANDTCRATTFALRHPTVTALPAVAVSAAAGLAAIARSVSLVWRHPSIAELVLVNVAAAVAAFGIGGWAFAGLVCRCRIGKQASRVLFAFSWLMCIPAAIAGWVGVFPAGLEAVADASVGTFFIALSPVMVVGWRLHMRDLAAGLEAAARAGRSVAGRRGSKRSDPRWGS